MTRPSRRGRLRLRGLTLRTQLIIGLVALMALLSGVIGGVSLYALDRFQLNQLDAQLQTAAARNAYGQHGLDDQTGSGPRQGDATNGNICDPGPQLAGLGPRTVSVRVNAGVVQA